MLTPEEQSEIDAHYREAGLTISEASKRIAQLENDLTALQAKIALARSALRAANLQSRPALIAERIEEAMNALE